MQINKLIGKKNLTIKILNPEQKPAKLGAWESVLAHVFPKTLTFLTDVWPNGQLTCGLAYCKLDGQIISIIVPHSMEVEVIAEHLPEKILLKVEKANLFNQLRSNQPMIGTDPEMFVEDENGQVLPAFEFLGSKTAPNFTSAPPNAQTPREVGNKKIYWDGFQGEFETNAEGCLGWLTDGVQNGLKNLLEYARKKNPKAKISAKTVVDIPPEMLASAKEEHVQFGCMPSKNAYGIKGRTEDGRKVLFRPAGGHIHFGFYPEEVKKLTEEDYIRMVKCLDAVIGVACVALFAKYDNPKRRELYGLAGEYRTPPHGLEYRTLSNAWLFHPMIMNLVFDVGRKAMIMGKLNLQKFWKADENEVIECINTCNVKMAQKILKRNKEVFLEMVRACYNFVPAQNEIIYKIFYGGMHKVVKDIEDIENNWRLAGNIAWQHHANEPGKNVATAVRDIHNGNIKKVA